MNPNPPASLLALDWGTSSARAYRLAAGGAVLDRREAPLGVMQVRESKYIMMHAPKSALAKISALLPGSEAPTVLPLDSRDDRVAVVATEPMTRDERWTPLRAGELAVFVAGQRVG